MNNCTLSILMFIVICWSVIICSKMYVDNKSDYMIMIMFVILLAFALVSEFTDLFCEESKFSCKNCDDGLSGKYIKQIPNLNTTKSEAINNIKEVIKTSYNYVSWRKYFIISAIIIFILFIYKQKFSCVDLLVMFIGCFVTLQLIGNFYKYHYEEHVNNILLSNLNVLEK